MMRAAWLVICVAASALAAGHHWVHPLAGPERALPGNHSRKFGAQRPFRRPRECRGGHCGVDLGSRRGDPIYAVYDGVVERIERDQHADPKSGRYLRIAHEDGTLVSRYIHLDSIRDDLQVGDRVASGERIGTLGSTGIFSSGPHLHFSLSQRQNGVERYVDPEPLLRVWELPHEAPPPKPDEPPPSIYARWVPEHWIWLDGHWARMRAAWRLPRPAREPAAHFVAFWMPARWVWTRSGWLWTRGGWSVQAT
jgi:hypothetical protein